MLVLALMLPMNTLVVVSALNLAKSSREAQLKDLRFTTHVVANALEAYLQRYLTVEQILSGAPSLYEDDLSNFQKRALKAFPDPQEESLQVCDSNGTELMTTAPAGSQDARAPAVLAAQQKTFRTRSPAVTGIFESLSHHDWVAAIEYPIFRDEKPYREISVLLSGKAFQQILDGQHLPEGWIGGIADRDGRYVARTLRRGQVEGQPISSGWLAALQTPGLSKFPSREGDLIVNANEVSPLSGWTVGIAVKESVLDKPVSDILRWAVLSGIAVSLFSIALAVLVARRITGPIGDLERKATGIIRGEHVTLTDRLPEVDQVLQALQTAVLERQQVEQDLRVSEDLLRTAAEGAGFGAHDFDAVSGRLKLSSELKQMVGLESPEEWIPQETAASFFHPKDREQARNRIREILKSGQKTYELEFRLRPRNSEVRWILDRGQIVRDPLTGRALRVTGVAIDITARKLAEIRQETLIGELNHRVKNTLAIVQAIATQTLRGTKDPASFSHVFSERLMSLARAHGLLTQTAWSGATLDAIVRAAVEPFLSNAAEGTFSIGGPNVGMPANATVALTLMLHELLTNASKYGALSSPRGRLSIRREISDAPDGTRIDLYWAESGGPSVVSPSREGFGTRLLTMSAEQLDGRFAIDYAPQGVRCHLSLPLPKSDAQDYFTG